MTAPRSRAARRTPPDPADVAAVAVLRWLAEPPLSSRMWRIALGRVREAIGVAERLRGRERRYALIRACRLLAAVDPPGWRTRGGRSYHVATPGSRAFDRAELALEHRLTKLARDGIGYLACLPLPEDPPRRRWVHPERRRDESRLTYEHRDSGPLPEDPR